MPNPNKNRRFIWVEARKLTPSQILPKRSVDTELVRSIEKHGVQQPMIVRPSPFHNGMYEIIDGHLRRASIQDNLEVLADVRDCVDDAEVFKISEATFRRKPRNTYERACFYSSWVKTVETQYGNRGAQTHVAEMAHLSQSEISHYLSINRLFQSLRSQNIAEEVFNALKDQSVNKLYALAKVEDQPATLAVAAKLADAPDMNLKMLKAVIAECTSSTRVIDRLMDEDVEEEEESESGKIVRLTTAVKELQEAVGTTEDRLNMLKSTMSVNPVRFLSPIIFKRLRMMLKALKKIEQEANRIARSGRHSSVASKQGGG